MEHSMLSNRDFLKQFISTRSRNISFVMASQVENDRSLSGGAPEVYLTFSMAHQRRQASTRSRPSRYTVRVFVELSCLHISCIATATVTRNAVSMMLIVSKTGYTHKIHFTINKQFLCLLFFADLDNHPVAPPQFSCPSQS